MFGHIWLCQQTRACQLMLPVAHGHSTAQQILKITPPTQVKATWDCLMPAQKLHDLPHDHLPLTSVFARCCCCCYKNGVATVSLPDATPRVLFNARNNLDLTVITSDASIDGADNDAPHINVRWRHGPFQVTTLVDMLPAAIVRGTCGIGGMYAPRDERRVERRC